MAYASYLNVQSGFRTLDNDERPKCNALLDEAEVIIDAYAPDAEIEAKILVSCRMVRRALGDGGDAITFPTGTTQGSVSALGYTQSFTVSNGSVGELYLSKVDRKLLKIADRIGSSNPFREMTE